MSLPPPNPTFCADCRRCARLASFLDEVKAAHPDYHARPVAPFGDRHSRLLIVGLAPGLHGANRSGRPFTGDYAGILLYRTLFRFGFATRPESVSADDGLRLVGCCITNAVKCLPPANKPLPTEIRECNRYLQRELELLPEGAAILALGAIAHQAVLKALGLKPAQRRFTHGAVYPLPLGRSLFDSYHCSRYNTQTKRLTDRMFEEVIANIAARLATPSQE